MKKIELLKAKTFFILPPSREKENIPVYYSIVIYVQAHSAATAAAETNN